MSEQRDIIERLRDRDAVVLSGLFHAIPTMKEAADEIASLRAQLAAMAKEHDAYYAELTGKYFDVTTQLASARKALEAIANHPESKAPTKIDQSSYAVGWAFWNVQHIAKAALKTEQGK